MHIRWQCSWWVVAALVLWGGAGEDAVAQSKPRQLAMMGIRPGAGADPKLAHSIHEAVVAELRRIGGVQVITQDEVNAMLGLERQKEALGCDDTACIAEIGGALGVDQLVTGSLSKLDTSWVIYLKRVDVRSAKVVSQSDRRIKGGSLDDLLDAIPDMARELLQASSALASPAAPAGAPSTASVVSKGSSARPVNRTDRPLLDRADKEGLVLFALGNRYVALNPGLYNKSPLFVSDGARFYKQRVVGSSRNGEDYGLTFWDPRYANGVERGLYRRDGTTKLTCGSVNHTLEPVPPKKAKRLLAKAKFFEAAWLRTLVEVAAAPDGTYFVVDQAREPPKNLDYRLFVGPRGKLTYLSVSDVMASATEVTYLTEAGSLKLVQEEQGRKALWLEGGSSISLSALSVYDYAARIYNDMGLYEASLGTPCDPAAD